MVIVSGEKKIIIMYGELLMREQKEKIFSGMGED